MEDEKKTEDLEEEELETAVEDIDEDVEEIEETEGKRLYEYLLTKELVDSGPWEELMPGWRMDWDKAAEVLEPKFPF